jgi:hypothetical protein
MLRSKEMLTEIKNVEQKKIHFFANKNNHQKSKSTTLKGKN